MNKMHLRVILTDIAFEKDSFWEWIIYEICFEEESFLIKTPSVISEKREYFRINGKLVKMFIHRVKRGNEGNKHLQILFMN